MADLTGLMTGTSSGIGLAVAGTLLQHNPDLTIVGCSRRPGPLASHPRFIHWETDLCRPGTALARARRFSQEFSACHLMLYAAGRGMFNPSPEWSSESLEELVQLNLTSALSLAGGLTDKLRKGRGLAVFIGSVASRERAPLGAAYGATKAGLKQFAEYYFLENRKHGVRVMHLCPGMVDTDFYAQERFAPQDGDGFSVDLQSLAQTVQFYFRGPGEKTNPTHLVIEPRMVGIQRKRI